MSDAGDGAGAADEDLPIVPALRVVIKTPVENHPRIGRMGWEDRINKCYCVCAFTAYRNNHHQTGGRFTHNSLHEPPKTSYPPRSDCFVLVCLTGAGQAGTVKKTSRFLARSGVGQKSNCAVKESARCCFAQCVVVSTDIQHCGLSQRDIQHLPNVSTLGSHAPEAPRGLLGKSALYLLSRAFGSKATILLTGRRPFWLQRNPPPLL